MKSYPVAYYLTQKLAKKKEKPKSVSQMVNIFQISIIFFDVTFVTFRKKT